VPLDKAVGTLPFDLLTPSRRNETTGNELYWIGTKRNEPSAQMPKALVEMRVRFPAAPQIKGLSERKALTSIIFRQYLRLINGPSIT
jgi:hypothetical protein